MFLVHKKSKIKSTELGFFDEPCFSSWDKTTYQECVSQWMGWVWSWVGSLRVSRSRTAQTQFREPAASSASFLQLLKELESVFGPCYERFCEHDSQITSSTLPPSTAKCWLLASPALLEHIVTWSRETGSDCFKVGPSLITRVTHLNQVHCSSRDRLSHAN